MDITLSLNNFEMEDINLLQTVFPQGDAGKKDHYLWKYFQNPHGECIIVKAIKDNEVIARVAFTPVLIWHPGKNHSFLAAQTVDTAILKKHRNFFILLECYDKALSKAREMGITCIYGFPNIDAYPVTVHGLGFKDLFSFYPMIYFPSNNNCSSSPLKNVLMKAISLRGEFLSLFVTNKQRNSFILKEEWNVPPELTSFESQVIKDTAYIEWRYRSCPGRDYHPYSIYEPKDQLQGKVIIQKQKVQNTDILVVSDIFVGNSENEAKFNIPDWLISIAQKKKLPIIYFANNKDMARYFSKKGYYFIPPEISKRNYTVVGSSIEGSFHKSFDHINFSLGDMDMG